MSESTAVFVGPSNGRAGRLVVFTHKNREYRDTFDTNSGFAREKAITRAAERFGLPAAELGHLDAMIVKAADEEDQKEEAPETFDYGAETVADLELADLETEFLIDRTLAACQPCIMAGSKKSLKTSLLIDLGVSLVMGGYFLGKLKVSRACRVALRSGESGRATIRETIRRVCEAAGYNPANITGMLVTEKLPRFGDPSHVHSLERFITENELDVLAIDPAYLAMPGGDAGNMMIMGEMLRELSEVCISTGCTPILCHHTRKGGKPNPFEPPELEDIAWAGFMQWCRQWLLVGRREKYEPGTGEHKLWLNVGGSAGHSALWAVDVSEGTFPNRYWQVEVQHADEARREAQEHREQVKDAERRGRLVLQLDNDKVAICQAMAKYPGGETKRTLRDTAGLSNQRFGAVLTEMLTAGEVEPVEVFKGNHKRAYEGYKLSCEDSPE